MDDDFENERRELHVAQLSDEWALLPDGAAKRFRDLTDDDEPLPSPQLDEWRELHGGFTPRPRSTP